MSLVNRLGVVAHVNITTGPYGDTASIQKALDWLGVKHIRSRYHPNIAKLNAKALVVCNTVAEASGATALANCEALEGINEPESKYSHGHPDWNAISTLEASMQTVARNAGKLWLPSALAPGYYEPLRASMPWPRVRLPAVGIANGHSYPRTDTNAEWEIRIKAVRNAARYIAQCNPWWCTESGTSSGDPTDVSAAVAAQRLPGWLSTLYGLGAKRVYWYELFDEPTADPNATNPRERTLGLFDASGNPKPIASAMRTLLATS